jgi:hypothetical protein
VTVCASCGTNMGPFVKNLGFGDNGPKVCGYPPRYKMNDVKKIEKRVSECNARREKVLMGRV